MVKCTSNRHKTNAPCKLFSIYVFLHISGYPSLESSHCIYNNEIHTFVYYELESLTKAINYADIFNTPQQCYKLSCLHNNS